MFLVFSNECSCKALGFLIARECHQDLTCIRNITEAKDLNRCRRTCFFDTSASVIHHCTHFTTACACCNKVAYMKCTFLYKNCGNRSLTFIKLSLNNKTSCRTIRICLEFQYLCRKKDHFKQCIDSLSCMGRYRYKNSTSTPVFRNQFIFGKFLFYSFHICTWFIDLVDCNNDLNTRCFRMADCLNSLWHNTIICCNNKYCDICGVCTTHTHCSKCFMSRCIQECDLLSIDLNYRCTNVLCDSTCFPSGYMCITDCIQKRCFTMVNVTHDTDYRRSRNHIRFIFFVFFQKFFDNVYFLFRLCDNIIIQCDLLCFFKVDLMVYRYHSSFQEQFFNDYRRLHLHSFCELTDCHFLRKCDFFYFWFLLFLFWLRSRFLKSFRNSGKISSSTLVRSVMTCTGFLKVFLFVLILSVTLSLAVFGCFCQFWCKYSVILSSSAAISLSATVVSAKASFTSVIRSSVSALSWSSLATLLRASTLTSHRTAISITLTCRTTFTLWSGRTISVTIRTTLSIISIAIRKSFFSATEITVSSVISTTIVTA